MLHSPHPATPPDGRFFQDDRTAKGHNGLHVYRFASNPENVPRWAQGLGKTIQKVDGEWIADSPMGKVKVRFSAQNDFGVLDHDVVLPSGSTVHNAMRVIPNGTGSEVIFTLLRLPDVSAQKFAEDRQAVERDLRKLKELLEK